MLPALGQPETALCGWDPASGTPSTGVSQQEEPPAARLLPGRAAAGGTLTQRLAVPAQSAEEGGRGVVKREEGKALS